MVKTDNKLKIDLSFLDEGKDSFTCDNCGKEFSTNKDLTTHQESCNQVQPEIVEEDPNDFVWTCDYCGEEFETKKESDDHEEKCDKNPNKAKLNSDKQCSKCGTSYADEDKFCKKCGNDLTKEKISYAGFWIRLGAWLIDYAGIFIFEIIVAICIGILGFDTDILTDGVEIILFIVCMVAYFWFFYGKWSTSPGKRIYGLSIETDDGNKLDWNKAFTRAFYQPFSVLFFGCGYWNMGSNGKEKAWHDNACHTVVIRQKGRSYFFPVILSLLGFGLYIWIRSL